MSDVRSKPHVDQDQMPEQLSSRHLRRRLVQLAVLVVAVALVVWLTPGLGPLRKRLDHASAPWLVVAGGFELLSTLSYVVIFRAVFCRRMPWRLSYQIGMAEQAANALLPAGGAGGLALGAWALSRGGMSATHIARRTVAFFFLTSLANVGTVAVFAAAFALNIFHGDTVPWFTYGFGIAAVVAIAITVATPTFYRRWVMHRKPLPRDAGRAHRWIRDAADALGNGATDTFSLLRTRPVGVLVGSFGYMVFDIATLGASFAAFGKAPGVGVLVFAYLVGQLGGLIPIPGGFGGTEGGLIGAFAVFNVSVAASGAAVLAYRVLQLWIPGVLGSIAFVQLRATLRRDRSAAAMCEPMAEPIEVRGFERAAG
ncbi:MAG TPA: flippase-like domain-containing protein [Solirubrobacteraceae bacterium]|nr:flippase-like domain-containing protein [Solirubrobacteraceae bacterium]